MTPQGISTGNTEQRVVSDAEKAATIAAQAATQAAASVHALGSALHNRLSNIESAMLTVADAVPSKLVRYGVPIATGLAGLIVGHLI